MGFFETVTHAMSESPLAELKLAKLSQFVTHVNGDFYWPKLLLDARYANVDTTAFTEFLLSVRHQHHSVKTTHSSSHMRVIIPPIKSSFHYFLHEKT